jgi:hypothetical protein
MVAACTESSGQGSSASAASQEPMEAEVKVAAARGLPIHLLPAGIDSPTYKVLRHSCAPAVVDREQPEARLSLVEQYVRKDQWMKGGTTMTAEYGEGLYSVMPEGLYGLAPGALLRVACSRYAATAVVSRVR